MAGVSRALLLIGLLLMPAPTTGLTAQFDASTNAELFNTFSGGVLSGNPSDGGSFQFWRSTIDQTAVNSTRILFPDGTSPSFTWHDDLTMRLPSVRANNGFLRTRTLGGTGLGFDDFMTRPAAMILAAFYIDSAGTYPNSSTSYFNCNLIGGGRNAYFGVFIRNNGGVYTLYPYNWDGNEDGSTIGITVTPDAAHVICIRHDGGSLFFSVDCGAELSVASGNTDNTTPLLWGDQGLSVGTVAEYRGRFGEALFYNHGQAAIAQAAMDYLCDKWLTPVLVDDADPTIPDLSCTVGAGGGQSAGGCVVAYPTIGQQQDCVGGGLVPTAPDLVHSEVWWGRA